MEKIKIYHVKPLTPMNLNKKNFKIFPTRKSLFNKNIFINLKSSKDDNQFHKNSKLKNKDNDSLSNSKKIKTHKIIYPKKNQIFPRQFSAPIFANINPKNKKIINDRYIPKKYLAFYQNILSPDLTKNSMNKTDGFKNIPTNKKLNSYYLLSNLPLSKKFLIEQVNYDLLSTKSEKKIDIENNYKKIDKLTNDLCLFQIKRELFKENSSENLIRNSKISYIELDKSEDKNIEKQNIKDNYNNTNTKYTNYNSISVNTQNYNSVLDKMKNKKLPETIKNLKQNNNSNNSIFPNNCFNKTKKLEDKDKENIFNCKKDEEFYRQIFCYHDDEKEPKKVDFIDNKYNLIYSENEDQYNQRLLKINDQLVKDGKNKIHLIEPRNNEIKVDVLKDKVKFIKRVIDYAYPTMVLMKVKAEKKRMFHSKSVEEKLPQFKIVQLASEQSKENLNLKLSGILKVNKF